MERRKPRKLHFKKQEDITRDKQDRRPKVEIPSDDECVYSVHHLHRNRCRGGTTQFSMDEIKERANLFRREYNQEDIHDRVLVLQVMPDGYEMRELTARLQLSEPASNVAGNDVELDVCGENSLASVLRTNVVHKTEDALAVEFGDECCIGKCSFEYSAKSEDVATVSYRNESKTERTSARCELIEETSADAEPSYSRLEQQEVTIASPCWEQPSLSTGYFYRKEKFWENERGFNVDTGSKDVSTNFEPAVTRKTEIERVESELMEETWSTVHVATVSKNDDESSSPRDVHVLREHRVYVHGCWLAANSRYFRSLLFESGMSECSTAEFSMKVSESEESAFLLLLKSIYDPDALENIDITPLMNVLRLSVKYDVRFSTIKAKRVLEATPLTLDVCETIIEAVNSGGLPELGGVMKNVERLLLSEFEPLDETWESEKFASLSEHAVRFVLGSDRLVVQSENTVFIALMQWMAKNAEAYDGVVTEHSDLLNLVRFEIMKPTYIHDVVRVHEIATQLEGFDEVYVKAMTNHALPPKRREIPAKNRQWCESRTPTFMWILYPEPEMFSFDEEAPCSSAVSSSFWYYGYKMHLQLDIASNQDDTNLFLVVENLSTDGMVELAYDVDVKFGEGLHRSFTCEPTVYRGSELSPPSQNYPFDEKFSVNEIKEILLGGSSKVAITFEVTVEKLLND